MKFKMISEADVKVLREARKVLKGLKKKENTLNAIEEGDLVDQTKEWKTAALEHWRMYDELDNLGIDVYGDGEFSLTV